jgi:hypothetical protein
MQSFALAQPDYMEDSTKRHKISSLHLQLFCEGNVTKGSIVAERHCVNPAKAQDDSY